MSLFRTSLALRVSLIRLGFVLGICAYGAFLTPVANAAPLTELQIGIGHMKPPYILGPNQTGIEYEIAQQALEASGYRMVPQYLPPARALALLRSGQLDGMLAVTEGIGGGDFFSDTYIHYQNVAITLGSRHIQLRDVDDLARYSVAAFQNARMILGEAFWNLTSQHARYNEYSDQITQNRLLYAGRVDVVVGDRLVFRYLNRQLDKTIDADQSLTYHAVFPPTPRKAVFRDAAVRDGFNNGLKAIKRNGTYAAIMKKYRSVMEP